MEDLEKFVGKVLNDLAALPEETMRVALLGRRLKELDPEGAALFLDALYKRGHEDRLARIAYSVLVDHDGLRGILGEEGCARIYLASVDLDLKKVSRLFTNLPPLRKGLSGYDSEEEAKMEFVSLGQRRELSKGFKKDTLDRLLSDPDPIVINNILGNPKITEKEVIKIASKRPGSPRILKLIAGHRVWSKRYGVIKAIVLNPYTPPRISVALLEVMLTQDLKIVAEDKTLHPQVKLGAKEILEERGVGEGGAAGEK